MRKLSGFIAFVLTGLGLFLTSDLNDMNLVNIGILIIVGLFFTISIIGHYNELKE